MNDLDFDFDDDGRTWHTDTMALDMGDDNDAYFDITSTTSGGWVPIGNETTRFTGIFEGNGFVIHNLAMRRSNVTDLGLFGGVSGSVRNLRLADALANYTGTSDTNIGLLVGIVNGGIVINCSSSGRVNGGGGDDSAGGLVGDNFNRWQSHRQLFQRFGKRRRWR